MRIAGVITTTALIVVLACGSAGGASLRVALGLNTGECADAVALASWGAAREQEQRAGQKKVLAALRTAAVRQGWPVPENLGPEAIEWPTAAFSQADDRLEVRGISFDPLLHQLRFRFRVAGKASAPWFSGWCAASKLPGKSAVSGEGRPQKHDSATAAALVSPRRPAMLYLHSENSFATLQVRPLEAGALGDSIRVRIPSNGHTLRARVVGTDLLDATF